MTRSTATAALIREVPLLARLHADDLRALADAGAERRYAAGAVIVEAGEPGHSLHVILSGRVRIALSSEDGTDIVLAHVGQGDCFGELAILDGRPRSASAIAEVATRTFVVQRNEFVTWLQPRPHAALALLETLSLRLRRMDEAFADICFLDLPKRLAKHLIRLAAEGNASNGQIAVTQSALATRLGVTRESINKQLNRFAQEGWIGLSRGAITLHDPAALERFV